MKGYLYRVNNDYVNAKKYYVIAIKEGNIDALNNLGKIINLK
jgi:TPR repeat protein